MTPNSGPADIQDAVNILTYEDNHSVHHYPSLSVLMPAEAALVERYREKLVGSRLLDIGVGGGRTTVHLAPLAASYVGIDYSAGLASATSERFPHLHIEQGDVRDLSAFDDHSFDVVVFSYNGLDSISHTDRLLALREVRRTLVDGGLFLFSSHNREFDRFNLLPWQGMRQPGRRMLREIRAALIPAARANRRRLRPRQVVGPDWAVINDSAHDYGLLNYYVTPAEVGRQLVAAGFADVRAHDLYGSEVPRHDTAPWLHYTARAD